MTKANSNITEDTKQAARKTVCAFSADSREAVEFMKMLGIHPSQNDSELDDVTPGFNTAHTPPRRLQ